MLLLLLELQPSVLSCWHIPYHPVITNGAVFPGQKPRSPHLPAASIDVARSKVRKTGFSLLLPFSLLAVPPIGRTKSKAIWQGIWACM